MNPRTERQAHLVAMVVGASGIAGLIYALIQGNPTVGGIANAVGHGVAISLILSVFEIVIQSGAGRDWFGSLPFTVSLLLRSAIYAAVILGVQLAFLRFGSNDVGPNNSREFWNAAAFAAAASIAINFVVEIGSLLGSRTFSNFVTGRYHAPVEENRFVLFVDIVGSTGLAEQLGGIGIHRFLDKTFRTLSESVVDYRGEVLDYVGDELIVTWSEKDGAIDCRPLRCFLAMRATLAEAAPRVRARIRRCAARAWQPQLRSGDHRRDWRYQARHRVQRRRDEYRSASRTIEPRNQRRLPRIGIGDRAPWQRLRRDHARTGPDADPRPCGRHRCVRIGGGYRRIG